MLGKLFGNADKEQMVKAKQEFEAAINAKDDSRETRSMKLRMGLRCRAVLDKTFIEGAERTAAHSEASMLAVANDEEKPKAPSPKAFQSIKSVNGEILAYLPLEYVEEVFKVGAAFQLEEASPEQAIELCQAVADKISEALDLDQPFEALGFLKEQLAEENGDEEDQDDDTGAKT